MERRKRVFIRKDTCLVVRVKSGCANYTEPVSGRDAWRSAWNLNLAPMSSMLHIQIGHAIHKDSVLSKLRERIHSVVVAESLVQRGIRIQSDGEK